MIQDARQGLRESGNSNLRRLRHRKRYSVLHLMRMIQHWGKENEDEIRH
jgi:hypothetical protein